MPTLATPGNQGSGAGPGELLTARSAAAESTKSFDFCAWIQQAYDELRFLPPALRADLTIGNYEIRQRTRKSRCSSTGSSESAPKP